MTTESFFNPLDRSQIAFIPADRESIVDIEGVPDTTPSLDGLRKPFNDQYSRRDSLAPSETSQSIFSDGFTAGSPWSSVENMERLSSVSSGSSCGTGMSHGIRYKVVLKLNVREINLIRNSWSMMLNDDLSGDRFRTVLRRIWNEIGASSWGSSGNSQRKSSVTSVRTPHTSKARAGSNNTWGSTSNAQPTFTSASKPISSGAFASSIFCSQFYGNLLYMEPAIEQMFPSIKHQAVSFAGVLTMAVNNLDDLSTLETYLTGLGKRHSRILAIEPPHFELMGMAFLKTIKERFGVHTTLELEETWSRLYSYLANSILQFGIDPVLKIDATRNEIRFPVPDVAKGLPYTASALQSPSMAHQSSSQKFRVSSTPEVMLSMAQKPVSLPRSNTIKTPKQLKKNEIPARSLYATNKSQEQDKDCVIM